VKLLQWMALKTKPRHTVTHTGETKHKQITRVHFTVIDYM